jgi:hypothetical protein
MVASGSVPEGTAACFMLSCKNFVGYSEEKYCRGFLRKLALQMQLKFDETKLIRMK